MSHFRMSLTIAIEPCGPDGQYNPGNGAFGNLRLEEHYNFVASDFLELSSVLGQFHELSKKLHEEVPQS